MAFQSFNWVDKSALAASAAPLIYTDLDLSTDIEGADKTALVFLLVDCQTSSASYWFRPNGETVDWDFSLTFDKPAGTTAAYLSATSNRYALICVMTDSSGFVEWKASAARTTQIQFLGYLPGDFTSGQIVSGNLSAGWNEVDIASIVSGSVFSLSWIRQTTTTYAAERLTTRPNDQISGDWTTIKASSAHKTLTPDLNERAAFFAYSGSDSKLGIWSSGVTAQYDLDVEEWVKEGEGLFAIPIDDQVVFSTAAPPTSYTTLDLRDKDGGGDTGVPDDRVLAILRIEADNSNNDNNSYNFKINGATGNWGGGTSPSGISSARLDRQDAGLVIVPTDSLGRVEWEADPSITSPLVEVRILGYIPVNDAPTFSGNSPIGGGQSKYVLVSTDISDDFGVDPTTIQMEWTHGTDTYDVIIDGVFQTGYGGTITANGSNGYDVKVITHPLLADGVWSVDVSADDYMEATGTAGWTFTVDWVPWLISARSIQRWNIELVFDIPIKLRDLGLNPPEPVDRWTPITWTGNSDDALNPANYTLTKPPGGNLSGPGESVDVTIVQVKEIVGYTEESGTDLYGERVEVVVDLQMTPRTDFNIEVQNVHWQTAVIDSSNDEQDFQGYIVSQVVRSSRWQLWKKISSELRRQDENIGDLQDFLSVAQEVIDRTVEDVDAFVDETKL